MKQLDEQKILNEYINNKFSMFKIAQLNCTDWGRIKRILLKHNIKYESRKYRKYTFDVNKFDYIDSADKSYWLGFLLGDGNIQHSGIRLELSGKDKDHLEKFKIFMSGNMPINPTVKNCFIIHLNNVTLTEKVCKWGFIPNKTASKLIEPNIHKSLLRHFYRGLIDSDGWICEHKSKKGRSGIDLGLCSNYPDILYSFQSYCKLILNKDCGSINKRKSTISGECWQFIIGGRQKFDKLFNHFYNQECDDSIRLSRKYLKGIELISKI